MKTKLTFCALALLGTMIAAEVGAQNHQPHRTTVHKLADLAQVVVVAELDRVESVELAEEGLDAAKHKRINDGSFQDGEPYIRRDGILKVNTVLKGDVQTGAELRFVSIRQLKHDAYADSLKNGEAVWFLHRRHADGRFIVIADERGTVTPAQTGGELDGAVTFIKNHLNDGSAHEQGIKAMLDAIALDGSRLSVDCALELSWFHQTYADSMTEPQRQQILNLMKLSPVGSAERNQLITAVGRHKPEGAFLGLLEVMLNDSNWSTTSLASMSLEYVDRGEAINALLSEWQSATDKDTKIVIVRSLGLIRPKADHDGETVRDATLDLVGGLLVPGTDHDLLREALIASRDLRSGDAHVEALKELIDNRESNGLGDAEVKAAVIALGAARKIIPNPTGPDFKPALAEKYLKELGESDPVLKQVVDSALKFPYTTLILGADGKGH